MSFPRPLFHIFPYQNYASTVKAVHIPICPMEESLAGTLYTSTEESTPNNIGKVCFVSTQIFYGKRSIYGDRNVRIKSRGSKQRDLKKIHWRMQTIRLSEE